MVRLIRMHPLPGKGRLRSPGGDRTDLLVHKLTRLSPASRNQRAGKTSDGEKGREATLMRVGTGGPFSPQELHGESMQVDGRGSGGVNSWGDGCLQASHTHFMPALGGSHAAEKPITD